MLAFQRQLKASIFVNKMIIKKKKVKIKHLLNIDHTSHFVATFFAYLTLSLWFSFYLYKSVDKSFILYFHTELFQRALMTVFVTVAHRALLVVMLGCLHGLIVLCSAEDSNALVFKSSHASCSTFLNLQQEEVGVVLRGS